MVAANPKVDSQYIIAGAISAEIFVLSNRAFAEKWEIWYPMHFNFYEERQHRNDS
jgi:hypothetical protein